LERTFSVKPLATFAGHAAGHGIVEDIANRLRFGRKVELQRRNPGQPHFIFAFMEHTMQALMRIALLVTVLVGGDTGLALAQANPAPEGNPPPSPGGQPGGQYSSNEVVDAGHRFFGTISRGLAQIVEKAGSQWGLPNGYILGQEAGGAVVAGLRYGEGILYTKNAGDLRVYWQGPSLGFDFGGDGARTMMLVYSLPATDAIYQRFVGIDGSAYFVGGLGMTALTFNNIVVVPIRSGVGFRLGANVGYLKFTPTATWNPF
jgi:hypothetical protein